MLKDTGTGTEKGTGAGTGAKKRGRPKGTKNKKRYTGTGTDKDLINQNYEGQSLGFSAYKTPEEMAYNAKLIQHIIQVQEIASHADRKDPASLRACFINYLRLCSEEGFKVSNMAAAACMGINIRTLDRWTQSEKPEYRELAEFVKTACSLSREQLISDGKINPVIGIFWQRNYDGLRNDTEQQQNLVDMGEDDQTSPDEYRKKYGHLMDME